MASSPTELAEQLGAWLGEAVALLLAQGGAVAAALIATCAGREAVIRLDDTVLRLLARQQDGALRLSTEAVRTPGVTQFETDAAALRDILDGQLLLDTAIVEGRVRLAAPLADLLAMHNLVMQAMACGPIQPALRTLWQRFDAQWPQSAAAREDCSLEAQRPRHGLMQGSVPADVLQVRTAAPRDPPRPDI
jgi:hypothetical protein